MRSIKVLRVLPSLEMGGVERTLISLIPYLQERGVMVEVCTLYRRDVLAEEIERIGVPLVHINMRARLDLDFKYVSGIIRLAEYIRKKNFDILHTHLYRANTPGRIAGLLARVPVMVANEHNIDSWKTSSQKRMDRFLARFTSKIIVVSEKVKDFYIREVGIPENKIIVIYNGIDLARFSLGVDLRKKRRELGIPEGVRIVGSVGRLHPQKDFFTFLKAARIVSERVPRVHFLIIGGGPLRRELEDFARMMGLEERVSFLGERKDVEKIYPLMDVFVLSSIREGFPISVLEAMACGIPVVATSVGGTPELIQEGETGFLVSPGDPQNLAKRIEILIRDKVLRGRMGRKGKERVREFSIEKMADRTLQLYRRLASEKREK